MGFPTRTVAGLPSWFQSGSGSPVGVVIPAQKGALYQDTTNGALYVAIGVTSANWINVGGLDPTFTVTTGVSLLNAANDKLYLTGIPTQGVTIEADNSGFPSIVLEPTTGSDVHSWVNFRSVPATFGLREDGGFQLPNGNSLFNTADTPSNALGGNGDWAVTANGKLCFKTGGAWVVVVSEAPGFRSLTTPPVSTTVYQNTTGFDLTASLRAVLAVNPVLTSDCKVEISPDNFGSAQVWADPALAAGALAVANAPEYIEFPIPANWFYKVTATNTTIGALVAIG